MMSPSFKENTRAQWLMMLGKLNIMREVDACWRICPLIRSVISNDGNGELPAMGTEWAGTKSPIGAAVANQFHRILGGWGRGA
jgi:hypothetical protein